MSPFMDLEDDVLHGNNCWHEAGQDLYPRLSHRREVTPGILEQQQTYCRSIPWDWDHPDSQRGQSWPSIQYGSPLVGVDPRDIYSSHSTLKPQALRIQTPTSFSGCINPALLENFQGGDDVSDPFRIEDDNLAETSEALPSLLPTPDNDSQFYGAHNQFATLVIDNAQELNHGEGESLDYPEFDLYINWPEAASPTVYWPPTYYATNDNTPGSTYYNNFIAIGSLEGHIDYSTVYNAQEEGTPSTEGLGSISLTVAVGPDEEASPNSTLASVPNTQLEEPFNYERWRLG